MLRRIENVSATWHRGFLGLFTGNGRLRVKAGRTRFVAPGKYRKEEARQKATLSQTRPESYGTVNEREYWRFEDRWYWDNDGLSSEEVYALLVTREQRRRATINRAQTIAAMADSQPSPAVRGAIPEDMKLLVWTRDEGRCRVCGANVELQYDHIIPWSKGGATSPENLQLLCGPCNRRKGASVASP